MKPLLIIPPAPARWPAMRALPLHSEALWQEDLEARFAQGVPRSQDAFAVIADGGNILASACISKRHDLGILNRVLVRSEHRGRGRARQVVETALSWFDITGGKWLYATASSDLAASLFGKFGFQPIRRAARTPSEAVVLLRAAPGVPVDPLSTADGGVTVHDITRANWPTMVVLLYNRPGPDPRVPLDESAVGAERTALELISQQEAGACHLKAAFRGPRLVGLASLASGPPGQRTFAVIMPHDDTPPVLRDAVVELARSKGYTQTDFPMEALAVTAGGSRAPERGSTRGDVEGSGEPGTSQTVR